MFGWGPATKIYLAAGATDMRKGFNVWHADPQAGGPPARFLHAGLCGSTPDVKTRAIPGHEFGLKLESREREQLIAFLRTI